MRSIIYLLAVCVLSAACSKPAATNQNTATPEPAPTAKARTATPEPMTSAPAAGSTYTDLSDKVCKRVEPDPDSGAIYEADCPGAGGYKVHYSESDHSQVLSLTDPQGKETLLAFRAVLNTVSDFYLGEKLEWRMDSKGADAKPRAMIVRLTKFTDPVDRTKTESFLAVVKLTGGETCVTDLVPGSADQNVKARQLADTKGRPCMKLEMEG